MKNRTPFFLALLLAAALAAPTALYAAATITIINADGANEGFNDPTPVAPVGGNPGTTRGEQRLNVFRAAADVWGAKLDSNVEIFVLASFDPLGANVLGSAGTTFVFSDFPGFFRLFPGSAFPSTWYHSALTDKLYGADGAPGSADIRARFSSDFPFYLGFDNNHGAANDLMTVVLHELGHGLGFANFVNETTGANLTADATDIFSHFTVDDALGFRWSDLPFDSTGDAQRHASAINFKHVGWDGANVTAVVPTVLAFGEPSLTVNSPAAIAGDKQFGTAAFGPGISAPGITGDVVVADDGVAPGSDACTALTAGSLSGKIGLADRGTCGFAVKAKIMQDAGAIAAIIANNAPGAPPGMAGVDPTITITTLSVSQADGNAIKANLPVNATMGIDLSRRAGTLGAGYARLYAPNPDQPGSSISHWDTLMFPNQLMEPAINPDLTHSVEPPQDMTLPQLRDVGWFPDGDFDGLTDVTDACLGSNLAPTIVIQSCDSQVANRLFTNGCTMSDRIASCIPASRNHGQFVKCVTDQANSYKKAGIITGAQKDAIVNCAINSTLP